MTGFRAVLELIMAAVGKPWFLPSMGTTAHEYVCWEKNTFDDEKNFKALEVQYFNFEFKVFQAEPKPDLEELLCTKTRREDKSCRS